MRWTVGTLMYEDGRCRGRFDVRAIDSFQMRGRPVVLGGSASIED